MKAIKLAESNVTTAQPPLIKTYIGSIRNCGMGSRAGSICTMDLFFGRDDFLDPLHRRVDTEQKAILHRKAGRETEIICTIFI